MHANHKHEWRVSKLDRTFRCVAFKCGALLTSEFLRDLDRSKYPDLDAAYAEFTKLQQRAPETRGEHAPSGGVEEHEARAEETPAEVFPPSDDTVVTGAPDLSVPTKVCTGCERSLPLNDFHRRARSSDGRQSRCKKCNIAAVKRSRARTARAGDAEGHVSGDASERP